MCWGGETIKPTTKVEQAKVRALNFIVDEMKGLTTVAEQAISDNTDEYWKNYYDALEELYAEISDWVSNHCKNNKELPDEFDYVIDALRKVVEVVQSVEGEK